MSKRNNFNDSTEITAEACAWMAQLNTGELTSADELALREWLQRSPRHAAELKKIAKLSMDINVLTEMDESIEQAAIQQHKLVKSSTRSSVWSHSFIAVSCAMVLAIGLFFLNNHTVSTQPAVMTTAVGEFKEVTLDDGTVVKMNTNTKLEVNYSSQVRKVRLLSGEVLFDVKHNPKRPFLVYVDEQYVRAVGTAFTVSLLRDELSVTVVEGIVEFANLVSMDKSTPFSKGSASATHPKPVIEPVLLEVGQHIAITPLDPVGTVKKMPDSELQRELSWQHELFDFSDTPLAQVIDEISRYSDMKIEILDDSLSDVKFGGIFRTNDTKPLFEALQTSYGINVEYIDNKHVQLSRVN